MRRPPSSLLLVGCLLAAVAAPLTFSGCGGGAEGAAGKRYIILSNGNSPFWDAARVGMNKAGEDLGVNVVMENCDGTPQDQISKLRQFANQTDIAAIGISAIVADNPTIVDELKKLQKLGVKIVTIDSDVNREKFRDARFAFIGTNNLVAGEVLGKAARGLKPEGGKWVGFVGRKGAQNAIERIEGFQKGAGEKFAQHDVMSDETSRPRAKTNVVNTLNNPEVDVLVGIWSYNAPAIADVVEEQNAKEKYTVVCFDAEPNAIKHMEKGNIDVMVVQNPYEMGYQGIRIMQALVEDDRETVQEMFPNHGQPDGDIYDTGLKVVVPKPDGPLSAEMFGDNVEFQELSTFQEWLNKYELTGS